MTTGRLPSRTQRGGREFTKAIGDVQDFVTLALDPITERGEEGIGDAITMVQTEMRKRKPTRRRITLIEAVCDIIVPALGASLVAPFPGEPNDPTVPGPRRRVRLPVGRGRLAVAVGAVNAACSVEALVRGRERLKPTDLPAVSNVIDAFRTFRQLTQPEMEE